MTDERVDQSQMEPDERGIPTVPWEKLGFHNAAEADDVQELFPGHLGKVARGTLYAWRHATTAQRTSKEFRDTVNSVNQDMIPGALEIPLDRYL